MELVLLGLALIGVTIVLPIYLLFSYNNLKAKVAILEARLAGAAPQDVAKPLPKAADYSPPKRMDPETPSPVKPPEPQATKVPPVPAPKPQSAPKAFVFKPEFGEKISAWLQKNWFYAVAGVSFAFAGIFLVQYGVENGLLSPRLRVLAALALGGILIGVGEYIRRKTAGDEAGSFVFLPSVFSGAGLVSLFAGVLSARLMYDLIGPNTAFVGLAMTGVIAIVLGWFYGPLLAIIGVFGALATPFLVGGDSSSAYLLQLYFAGIAAIALAIDSVKRWAWLSVLGLIGAYGAATVLYLGDGSELYFTAFALLVAVAAVILPQRRLIPRHNGPMVSQISTVVRDGQEGMTLPEFPTRVAAGAFVASVAIVGLVYLAESSAFWLSLAGLSLLFIGALMWMHHAKALADLAFVPALVGMGVILLEGLNRGPIRREWVEGADRPVLDYAPSILATILLGSVIVSLLFAWRSWRGGKTRLLDTIFAGAFAPLVAGIFEISWRPEFVLGDVNWALYLAGVAIVMTLLAERFLRRDGADRLRGSLFALSAMSMISFMAFTILGSFALTLALAVQVAAASWMGRQFNLPLLDRYVQFGVLTVSWRLVIIPGLEWAFEAPLWEVGLAFIGGVALLVAAYTLRRKAVRIGVTVMLESAIWSLTGVYLTMMLVRYFDHIGSNEIYLATSMIGLIWMIISANQLYRIRPGAGLRRTRMALAGIFGVLGMANTGFSVFLFNPLNGLFERGLVIGPYVFDSLAAAYALPAMLLGFVALRFTHLGRNLRKALGVLGGLLGALYIGLEIRRWWQGDDLSAHGVMDGELYSYTIAMLLAAVVLLVLAFLRRSALLRKLALVAVALTVAKVYLVDMSGLDGLLRVVSFLVLAVVLAAMAWVNRLLQNNEAKDAGRPD